MKLTSSLKDRVESTEINIGAVGRASEHGSNVGCTCDRWGHPCKNCIEKKDETKTTVPTAPTSH